MASPAQRKKIQIIVTIGPAARTEADLMLMKQKGVDFVRLNMSHSTTKELEDAIALAKKIGIPFIVDTEGSQIRTGRIGASRIEFAAGQMVRVHSGEVVGDHENISLTPGSIVRELTPGDILYCDFDSLALCVSDVSSIEKGYVSCRVIAAGSLGSNKGVYVDTASGQSLSLPTLTPKDYESIAIGLREGVEHVAASFMRSGEAVEHVRETAKGRMKIISKVECIDGLRNLDDIIAHSDALLVDRGDLSKEIFLHRIPFTQKIIVHRARRLGKPVIVATNFLESMVHSRTPTRAEVHDIESSITDGAAGLTLAAETAIGKYPFACITTMQNVISHVTSAVDVDAYADKEEKLVGYLESQNYLLDFANHSALTAPHGGTLVQQFRPEMLTRPDLKTLPSLTLDERQEMDAEQLALGGYSPLRGFMIKSELENVLETMRLPSGVVWPLPIVLATSAKEADGLTAGKEVLLKDHLGNPFALLHLDEKYRFNKKTYAQKLYGTLEESHPGVTLALQMGEVFLGGSVTLLRRRISELGEYELAPSQTRRLFESLGWSRVVGFHTRNVIHRGHEHIQELALAATSADGLFVHPVVGKKKRGDFLPRYIIEAYKIMLNKFYPPGRVQLGVFPSWSRYAGPREALFTALVRKNYGCSHFIVGRDHTGVGAFYGPTASHDIFDQFPDIGIVPVRFGQVFYSAKLGRHVHERDVEPHAESERLTLSGTQARTLFERGDMPPEWFMRPEIALMIAESIKSGERVFEE